MTDRALPCLLTCIFKDASGVKHHLPLRVPAIIPDSVCILALARCIWGDGDKASERRVLKEARAARGYPTFVYDLDAIYVPIRECAKFLLDNCCRTKAHEKTLKEWVGANLTLLYAIPDRIRAFETKRGLQACARDMTLLLEKAPREMRRFVERGSAIASSLDALNRALDDVCIEGISVRK